MESSRKKMLKALSVDQVERFQIWASDSGTKLGTNHLRVMTNFFHSGINKTALSEKIMILCILRTYSYFSLIYNLTNHSGKRCRLLSTSDREICLLEEKNG